LFKSFKESHFDSLSRNYLVNGLENLSVKLHTTEFFQHLSELNVCTSNIALVMPTFLFRRTNVIFGIGHFSKYGFFKIHLLIFRSKIRIFGDQPRK
jgi:hypothetical protein